MRWGLIHARRERRLSQTELVDLLKARYPWIRLQRTAISRWETGSSRIPADVLLALEALLDTPAAILYKDHQSVYDTDQADTPMALETG